MAFVKKTWKNRISENPLRRTITNVTTGVSEIVDVTRYEGTVTQEGDAFSAANMNDLEQRIEDGLAGGGSVFIAGVEASDTAANAYTIGQYLIYNGILYRAIQAISVGNSLVEGVNIISCKIADEVSDHLVVNGNGFYFDYHDGEYGYNTSPLRGADTFSPFKGSAGDVTEFIVINSGTGTHTTSLAPYKGYEYLIISTMPAWNMTRSYSQCAVVYSHELNYDSRIGSVDVLTDITDDSSMTFTSGSGSITHYIYAIGTSTHHGGMGDMYHVADIATSVYGNTVSLAPYKDYERIVINYLFTYTDGTTPYVSNASSRIIWQTNTGGDRNPRQGMLEAWDITDNSTFYYYNGSHAFLQIYTY